MKSRRGVVYLFLLLFSTYLYPNTIYFPKAKLKYTFFDSKKVIYSNDIKYNIRATSTIEFYKYDKRGEVFELKLPKVKKNGRFLNSRLPKISKKSIKLDKIRVKKSENFFNDDAIFIQIKDTLANKSKNRVDELIVTVRNEFDFEVLKLYESAKDSGIFRGYFQPSYKRRKNYDGLFFIRPDTFVKVSTNKVDKRIYFKSSLRSLSSYSNHDIWLENLSLNDEVSKAEVFESKVGVINSSNQNINSNFLVTFENGLKYVKGSLKVDGKKVTPRVFKNRISFNLNVLANSKSIVSYILKVGSVNKNELVQNVTFLKNNLQIKSFVKDDFDTKNSIIVGKVAFGTKGVGGVKIYLENGISTITDKNGRYHFEGIKPDFHVVKVDPSTIESRFEIKSCTQNILYAGSKTTKFVDTSISHIARADFCLKYVGKKAKKQKNFITKKKAKKMPKFSKESFTKKENKILWPPKDFNPPFPSIKLAFMHQSDLKFRVFINNKEVDKLAYDGFEISKEKDFKIEKYRGVLLKNGDNRLKIELLKDKKIVKVLTQNIHFSTSPIRAEVVKSLSRLKVDATTSPILAIRLYDKDGYPVRRGLVGRCSINDPYMFKQKDKTKGVYFIKEKKRYEVDEDGIVYLKLKPTSISGEVKIYFDFLPEGEYVSSWLQIDQKKWIVVGFVKGGIGYKLIKKNMQPISKRYSFKSKNMKFFAKGRVDADTILTVAYDSSKKVDLTKLENSNLKKSYLVFVDNSKQQNEAPTSQKLYIKLERSNFYTLFGDFETSLKSNLITYNIATTGVESKLKTKKISFNAFVSKSKYLHLKDEIIPNGSSGKYFLKNKNIIQNSESIVVVTRDKDDFNKVIKREYLKRDVDYNIDYVEGSIYFKDFQFATDENFNKRYIVVDYEILPTKMDRKNLTYGAKVGFSPTKNIKVSTTYINSKKALKVSKLQGIEVMLKLFKGVEIDLEGARSKEDKKSSSANSAELKYHKKNFSLNLSYIKKGKDYGIENQENLQDLDSKIGSIKASYDISKTDKVTFLKDHKKIISTKNTIQKDSLKYFHKGDSFGLGVGFKKIAKDKKHDKKAEFLIRKYFLNSKLITNFSTQKSIGKSSIEPDFTLLGVDYMLKPSMKLFAKSKTENLKDKKTKMYKAGVISTPWKGANTNLSLTTQKDSFNSENRFLNCGLTQNIKADKNLNFTLGYDMQKDLKGKNNLEEYKNYTFGLRYKKDKLNYIVKTLYKDSKDDKLESTFSVFSSINDNFAVAFGLRGSKVFTNEKNEKISAKVVFAKRDKKSQTILLNKTNLSYENQNKIDTKKVVNNTYIDTKLAKNMILDTQVGLKYFKTKLDSGDYSDFIGLVGLDIKYDFTKKFSINSQVSMSFSVEDKTYELSAGSSLGYSPIKDGVIYLGYNIKGFDDEDFESDVYRIKGAYMNFLFKFDEFSLSERARRSVR